MPIIDDEGRFSAPTFALWCLAGVALLLVLWAAIAIPAFGFRVATAGIVGKGEARIQIQSAPFRITAYNHFFDVCASVQTNEAQIDALTRELDSYDRGSSDYGRVQSNITGVTAARAGGINQYNADALKDYTQGQFKDSDLPYQLPTTAYVPNSGGGTRCASQ